MPHEPQEQLIFLIRLVLGFGDIRFPFG